MSYRDKIASIVSEYLGVQITSVDVIGYLMPAFTRSLAFASTVFRLTTEAQTVLYIGLPATVERFKIAEIDIDTIASAAADMLDRYARAEAAVLGLGIALANTLPAGNYFVQAPKLPVPPTEQDARMFIKENVHRVRRSVVASKLRALFSGLEDVVEELAQVYMAAVGGVKASFDLSPTVSATPVGNPDYTVSADSLRAAVYQPMTMILVATARDMLMFLSPIIEILVLLNLAVDPSAIDEYAYLTSLPRDAVLTYIFTSVPIYAELVDPTGNIIAESGTSIGRKLLVEVARDAASLGASPRSVFERAYSEGLGEARRIQETAESLRACVRDIARTVATLYARRFRDILASLGTNIPAALSNVPVSPYLAAVAVRATEQCGVNVVSGPFGQAFIPA